MPSSPLQLTPRLRRLPRALRASPVVAVTALATLGGTPALAAGPTVTTVSLINADTDLAMPGYTPFTTGAVLNLAALPTKNLNLQAFTSPAVAGSVVFSLDGAKRIQNSAPYAYAGDLPPADFKPWTPPVGTHTLLVTAYSAINGTGTAGPTRTYSFSVRDTPASTPGSTPSTPASTPASTPGPTTPATTPTATTPARTTPVSASVIRVDAGASRPQTDSQGNVWEADTGRFTPSRLASGGAVTDRINGTVDDNIFATSRSNLGNTTPQSARVFEYAVPITATKVAVKLLFAEPYWTAKNRRRFDVYAEGVKAIANLDLVAATGGKGIALTRSISNLTVTGGVVNLRFQALADFPLISGIEVTCTAGCAPTSPPATTPPTTPATTPTTPTTPATTTTTTPPTTPATTPPTSPEPTTPTSPEPTTPTSPEPTSPEPTTPEPTTPTTPEPTTPESTTPTTPEPTTPESTTPTSPEPTTPEPTTPTSPEPTTPEPTTPTTPAPTSPTTPEQSPWTTPIALPATIQAEDFDRGGEGVAYHDTDPANLGNVDRSTEGVDLEPAADAGGGYAISHLSVGEWTEYTVNIATPGLYDIGIRFASGASGGRGHLDVGGADVTGTVALGGTGGWQNWTTYWATGVSLQAAQSTALRFTVDASNGGVDIGKVNSIIVRRSATQLLPFPTSWPLGMPAPQPRFESAATLLNGTIYSFGAFSDAAYRVNRTYVAYDIAANRWTSLGTLPEGMAETHLGITNDGRYIYFAGGFGGDLHADQRPSQWISDAVWRYDPENNSWLPLPSLPQPRGAGTLARVGRQLHYFGGNLADRFTNVGDHYVYDLDTSQWTTAAPMPEPKDHFSSIVIGDKIYAFGGEYGHDVLHQQRSTMHVYDTTTDTWRPLANMPVAKSHTEAGTYLSDGQIIMAGGQVDNSQPTAQVASYNPATDVWTTLPPLPAVRQGAIVQRFGNQVVVTQGGVKTNQPQSTTWLGPLS